MRQIIFYRLESGKSPVEEFLNQLSPQLKKKAAFVLSLVEDLPVVPKDFFKKMKGTDDLWEVRVQSNGDKLSKSFFGGGCNFLKV